MRRISLDNGHVPGDQHVQPHRKALLDIGASAVTVEQCRAGEAVAQVVQTGWTTAAGLDRGAIAHLGEPERDIVVDEPCACQRHKEVGAGAVRRAKVISAGRLAPSPAL